MKAVRNTMVEDMDITGVMDILQPRVITVQVIWTITTPDNVLPLLPVRELPLLLVRELLLLPVRELPLLPVRELPPLPVQELLLPPEHERSGTAKPE